MAEHQSQKFSDSRGVLGFGRNEQYRTHWAVKEIDLHQAPLAADIVPAKIDLRIDERPPEPPSGNGPQYHSQGGKLSELSTPPLESETTDQQALHSRLSRDAVLLAAALKNAANRFPELANAAAEYSNLLDAEIGELDVVGVWSVGGALASFAQAYREQNVARTMSDPLEPQLDASLRKVVRLRTH